MTGLIPDPERPRAGSPGRPPKASPDAPGAVRDFVERADDELWLQLLTMMRKAEDPGLAAIQAILGWLAADV